MNRRDFIKSSATLTAGVLFFAPRFARSHETLRTEGARRFGYRIHGNKKLGCSGFDFPDDPEILSSGRFMPHSHR